MFPFDSLTITLVSPADTGVIVSMLPSSSAVAIEALVPFAILNSPAFVPLNVILSFCPPTYNTTSCLLACISVSTTVSNAAFDVITFTLLPNLCVIST